MATQPKDKRRKQKKRVARKPKSGTPLPKSVQALLKYLSGSGTGIGSTPAPTGAVQQFQAAAPPPALQPAGVPQPRATRVKKVAATAAVPSPLQSIVPQPATQTTIIQVPVTAPTQEKFEAEKQIATLQATAKQQEGQIEKLKLGMKQQGAGFLSAELFSDIQKQIQEQERRPQPPSLRSSQAPSTPSFNPPSLRSSEMMSLRTSMRGSEAGGEARYESAPRPSSVTQSEQSVENLLESEASGLGEHLAGQYIQNVSNPIIPEKRMGRGRPAKSDEEKKATRTAAAQRRKELKQLEKQQTYSESLQQLSGLGTSAQSISSGSSTTSAKSRTSGRAQQVFSQAQQAGADPSSTIRAMVAAGGTQASLPQVGGGLSLGELQAKKKPILKLKK